MGSSISLNLKKSRTPLNFRDFSVGLTGFEPATLDPQTASDALPGESERAQARPSPPALAANYGETTNVANVA
jgi:hypothetical protein